MENPKTNPRMVVVPHDAQVACTFSLRDYRHIADLIQDVSGWLTENGIKWDATLRQVDARPYSVRYIDMYEFGPHPCWQAIGQYVEAADDPTVDMEGLDKTLAQLEPWLACSRSAYADRHELDSGLNVSRPLPDSASSSSDYAQPNCHPSGRGSSW